MYINKLETNLKNYKIKQKYIKTKNNKKDLN